LIYKFLVRKFVTRSRLVPLISVIGLVCLPLGAETASAQPGGDRGQHVGGKLSKAFSKMGMKRGRRTTETPPLFRAQISGSSPKPPTVPVLSWALQPGNRFVRDTSVNVADATGLITDKDGDFYRYWITGIDRSGKQVGYLVYREGIPPVKKLPSIWLLEILLEIPDSFNNSVSLIQAREIQKKIDRLTDVTVKGGRARKGPDGKINEQDAANLALVDPSANTRMSGQEAARLLTTRPDASYHYEFEGTSPSGYLKIEISKEKGNPRLNLVVHSPRTLRAPSGVRHPPGWYERPDYPNVTLPQALLRQIPTVFVTNRTPGTTTNTSPAR
jgi:hypothetical protein